MNRFEPILRRATTALLLVLTLGLAAPGDCLAGFPHPEAPRLMNYYLRAGPSDIVGMEEFLSRWDMLVLPYQVLSWYPESLAALRAYNPDQLLLVYIDPVLISQNLTGQPGDIQYDYVAGAHDEWYALNEYGDRIVFWSGFYHTNITEVCPTVAGEQFLDYFIRFCRERFSPAVEAGIIDGIFLDEMSYGGYLWWDDLFYGSFDYNLNQIPDRSEPDIDIGEWLKDAMGAISDSLTANMPEGGVVIGNNCKPRHGALNGKLYEVFPADGWEGGLQGTLIDIDVWNSLNHDINVQCVNGVDPEIPTDLQAFRYRYAGSLLSDNYFSFDHDTENHHQLEWFDLFDHPLGLPLAGRYTLNETPVMSDEFENAIGDYIDIWSPTVASITHEPGLVLQGGGALLVDVPGPYPWPSPMGIRIPGGYLANDWYTVSFRFRILDCAAEEEVLMLKAKSENDNASSVQTWTSFVNAGAEGLFRARFQMLDYDNYVLYLKTKGQMTFVMDSLTVVAGPGGLLARDYEGGVAVCNDSGVPQILRYNDAWILAEGDGQTESYPDWNEGGDITLAARDGLVFLRDPVSAEDLPERPRTLGLSEPWPNPGNPAFSVRLTGEEASPVTLSLHDVRGRSLATLWQGELPEEGQTLNFRSGSPPLPELASGLYLLYARAESAVAIRRWVLLR